MGGGAVGVPAGAGAVFSNTKMSLKGERRRVRPGAWAAAVTVVLWSVLPAAAGAAERVALVIGNAAYEHVSFPPNPGNDAKAVGDAFERLGYAVTRLMDADYDALRKGLRSFKQEARGKEVAVVFYAGHGIGVQGSNYLVPVDVELGYADAVEAEERHRAEEKRKKEEEAKRLARKYSAGKKFRDCPVCPEMVMVPSGSYRMGSRSGDDDELPVHEVTIARPFAVGVYEVTFGEWDACVRDGDCGGYRRDNKGWGRGNRPVVKMRWDDAKAYVEWLSGKTGEEYRLLSEAEWEYVARAGTTTKYWWGNDIGRNRANCGGCGSRWDGEQTAPVGSFSANPFGLHDVHGNVWEWVEDCWSDSYHGAPSDGSAWESGNCGRRVVRGGSWYVIPWFLRSVSRISVTSDVRGFCAGFRVARTLTP